MTAAHRILRLGTRPSKLAQTQSAAIAKAVELLHPSIKVELTIIKTSGDQITDKPLHEFGGKGLFTKEIEQALLDGIIDFAVHSYKDVPITQPLVSQEGLIIAASAVREDPCDVLAAARPMAIADLPPNARVGTGSLRRRCQLLALRPDLRIEAIRGNVDTRLKKLREGQFDAIVLAMAGLNRLGLFDPATMRALDPSDLVPAAGQGALALQCRREDDSTRTLLASLNDRATSICVAAERALVALLDGNCLSPIGALATIDEAEQLRLVAAVGGQGGLPPALRAEARAPLADANSCARKVFDALIAQGAQELLHGPFPNRVRGFC